MRELEIIRTETSYPCEDSETSVEIISHWEGTPEDFIHCKNKYYSSQHTVAVFGEYEGEGWHQGKVWCHSGDYLFTEYIALLRDYQDGSIYYLDNVLQKSTPLDKFSRVQWYTWEVE